MHGYVCHNIGISNQGTAVYPGLVFYDNN